MLAGIFLFYYLCFIFYFLEIDCSNSGVVKGLWWLLVSGDIFILLFMFYFLFSRNRFVGRVIISPVPAPIFFPIVPASGPDCLDLCGQPRSTSRVHTKDGFGSDTDEIGSECHLLPHFNLDTNANADLIGYEYKMDSSNPNTFSI